MSLPLPGSPEPQWPVPPVPEHKSPEHAPSVNPGDRPGVPDSQQPDEPTIPGSVELYALVH